MASKSIDIKVKTSTDLTGIKKLRQEFQEVRDELAEALMMDDVDPAKIEALTMEAARLKDTMADVNEQVDVFATGSKYEAVSKSIGSIGKSILTLDFDKASARAQAFATAAKKITFKDAIKSVKALGSTFMTVGRAILTNPLFLIGAVIALIVVGVYKFLDSLGIMEDILAVIMAPLNMLMDGLKALGDWFTAGAISAQENAEKKAKAYEDAADRIEIANDKSILSISQEIRMAKLSGEDVEELEREKLKLIHETAQAKWESARQALEAGKKNKKITEDELQALKDAVHDTKMVVMGANNDILFQIAVTADAKKKAREKEDADELKDAQDLEKERARARLEALAKQKEYNQNRLSATRAIEDMQNLTIEEGIEKEIILNNTKYTRLIEDTKTNEKLKAEEKATIIKLLEDQQITNEEKIRKEKEEKDAAEIKAASEQLSAMMMGLEQNRFTKERELIISENEETLSVLREQREKGLINKEEFDNAEIALEIEKQRRLKELVGGIDGGLSVLDKKKKEAADLIAIERQRMEAGIIDEKDFADRREAIEKDVQDFIKKQDDEAKQRKLDNAGEILGVMSSGLGAISSLMEASMEAEINAAEGNADKQEAIRKRAFEANKKMQIAMAFMGMAQGVIAGLGAPFPMNIALPIIAGITGLANIQSIKNQTYQGGTPPTTDISSSSASSSMERSMPSATFMGQGNNQNTVGAGGSNDINVNVNAVVSETEITNVQNKNVNRQKNAEL